MKDIKVKIVDGTEGAYWQDIVIPNYAENNKVMKKRYGSSFPQYYIYSKKEGVIFGRVEASGDQLDGWANHVYYVAVDEETKKVIGAFHVSHGWHGTQYFGKYGSVKEWKQAMLDKVKSKEETAEEGREIDSDAEILRKVTVYDNGGITADRYTIVFPTGDIYLMSRDADRPNGVCMYAGDNPAIPDKNVDKKVDVKDLPEGVKKKIKYLMSYLEEQESDRIERDIYKGKIIAFHGTWMSGLATLEIEDYDRGIVNVPCDNAQIARALDSAFGGVIGDAHTVLQDAIQGKEIFYGMDDMGLVLGFIIPVENATPELIEAYERTKASITGGV